MKDASGCFVPMPNGGVRLIPPPKISDQQIAESYARLHSVWAVGRELGMAGQTVHKRMNKAGLAVDPIPSLTKAEKSKIRLYYETTHPEEFSLLGLAADLGRTRSSISRFARTMGLTKRRPQNAEVRSRQGATISKKWKSQGHPRGALGMVHTDATRAKMSVASKRTWATSKAFGVIHMAPEVRDARSMRAALRMSFRKSGPQDHTRALGGRRDDLGDIWFRSSWEANYARYLNLLMRMKIVVEWSYEPKTFWFDGIRRGCVSYRPDFRVVYKNAPIEEYVEIKGWVTAKDRTKWKRMKKYHPQIRLIVIAAKEYRDIENRWRGSIPEWERGAVRKATGTRLMGKVTSL